MLSNPLPSRAPNSRILRDARLQTQKSQTHGTICFGGCLKPVQIGSDLVQSTRQGSRSHQCTTRAKNLSASARGDSSPPFRAGWPNMFWISANEVQHWPWVLAKNARNKHERFIRTAGSPTKARFRAQGMGFNVPGV